MIRWAVMKIAVLLSGGVDSSTALRRLIDAGHTDIRAYYLKIWLEDDTAYLGECPWEEDLRFAQAVCSASGVELELVPLQLQYYDRVVAYALAELKAGRTPSPDIFCNQRIKFGAFLEDATLNGAKVASGHYAQVDWKRETFPGENPSASTFDALHEEAGIGTGRWRLLRAPDPVKDQTYFLSHLSQSQLGRILFPIGDLPKSKVRDLAHTYNLANQDRPDSQGICFLGNIRYPDFVKHYLGVQDGPIVELETGKELGRHSGFWFHTVGQRTGLKLGNGPWYVAAKDSTHNIVYASHGLHIAERDRDTLEIGELNWLTGRAPTATEIDIWNSEKQDPDGNTGLLLKLRHGPQLIPCALSWNATGEKLRISMEQSDRGIAAGQFAVLYRGTECLGGGKIQELDESEIEQLRARYIAAQERSAEALSARRAKRTKNRPAQ